MVRRGGGFLDDDEDDEDDDDCDRRDDGGRDDGACDGGGGFLLDDGEGDVGGRICAGVRVGVVHVSTFDELVDGEVVGCLKCPYLS